MELKSYAWILFRRWPIVAGLPILAIALGLWAQSGERATYSTEIRASIVRTADPAPSSDYAYDSYYNYLSSEFALDDLVEALRGNVFAQAVAERTQSAGLIVDADAVQSDLSAQRIHRVVTLRVTSHEPSRAHAIAESAAAELEENAFRYISVSAENPAAMVKIIQRPGYPGRDVTRARLLILLEAFAALGMGVLIAFLVDYLSDTIYDGELAAAATRLPVLASVPRERRA